MLQSLPVSPQFDALCDHANKAVLAESSQRASMPDHAIEVIDGAQADWDDGLAQFRDSSFDQSDFLGGALWGGKRLSKLFVKQNGRTIAAAQVFLFTLPKPLGGGVAYVKFGPLWRDFTNESDLGIYRLACEALIEEYAIRRRLCLTIVPGPDPVHSDRQVAILRERGFAQQRSVIAARRYMVDLSLTPEVQRSSLSSKWRYNLKKSEKCNIAVSFHQDQAARETFMRLHNSMRGRKNYSEATWVDEFDTLVDLIPANLQPTIALATHEGQAVAGAVIGVVGDTAVYLFGGTSQEGLQLRAGYRLQWEIVRRLSENRSLKWYDLDNDAAGNPGLRQFKSGLVGRRGVTFELPGEFDYCVDWRSRMSVRFIQGARNWRNLARRTFTEIRSRIAT